MNLLLNEVDVENVRTAEFRGRDHLVAPVVPMRAMHLDKGYVPEAQVEKSAPAWNGTPVTLNHPRDEVGRLISANSPNVAEKTWLGHLFNTNAEDDAIEGEIWLDIEHAENVGDSAADVLENVRSGEPVSVSTSYFGDELPAGNYDGEHRDEVMGNLRPDHLAILPNKEGKCSIADGCMAGPEAAANDAHDDELGLHLAAVDDADTPNDPVEPGEASASPTGSEPEDNVKGAFDTIKQAVFGDGSGAEPDAENDASGADDTPDDNSTMSDRDDMIEFLVNEHEFAEDSLDGMGDSCLERTFESFNEADESSGDGGTDADGAEATSDADTSDGEGDGTEAGTEPEDGDEDDEETVEMTPEEIEAKIDEHVEEALAANEERQQRQSLVDEITANTDEYDEEKLSDTPVAVLEKLADDASEPAGNTASHDYRAQRGASASAGDDDAGSFPALSANERLEEVDD